MTDARQLTLALDGRWYSSYGTARCPAHDDRNPSLTIRDGADAVLLSCKAGCPREAVIAALKAQWLWGSREHVDVVPWQPPAAKLKPSAYWRTKDAPRETQRACDLWREACGFFRTETPAGRYLIGRGIPPPWPEMLAFGRLDHPETHERNVPALIVARHCPVVHLVRGIQRIFLTEDGHKYQRGTCKMSLGSIAGGRAELVSPDAELVLCEGVESALSACRLLKTPAWAMCGGFPSELPLPARIREITLIADNDLAGTSERLAKVLAKSIRADGRICTVIMPVQAGADANDVLRGAA
jgi:hypothetical protein